MLPHSTAAINDRLVKVPNPDEPDEPHRVLYLTPHEWNLMLPVMRRLLDQRPKWNRWRLDLELKNVADRFQSPASPWVGEITLSDGTTVVLEPPSPGVTVGNPDGVGESPFSTPDRRSPFRSTRGRGVQPRSPT